MRLRIHLALSVFILIAIGVELVGAENGILRILCGLPLVLVLPGYTMMSAAFPSNKLGIAVRLMLVLGVSFTVAIIAGFVLNLTSWGMRPDTWAVTLGSIAFVANGIGWYRSRNLPAETFQLAINRWKTLALGLALILIIAAIQVARVGAIQSQQTSFTQFWMLPSQQQNMVIVGVSNQETESVQYRVDVKVNGSVLREWSPVTLQVGETWTQTIMIPSGQNAEAQLYRLDHPEAVYRRVELWREK